MPDSTLDAFQSLVRDTADALPPDIEIEFRKMFGGMAAYARGRVFAVTSDAGLALKLAEEDRAKLLLEEGAAYLQRAGESLSKQYIDVPRRIQQDRDQLRAWVERSVGYALTLPLPEKKRKRG